MGIDIYGWVEVRETQQWRGILEVGVPLWLRDYSMFENLFRYLERGYFQPIAAYRGIPQDVSQETQVTLQEDRKGFHEFMLDAARAEAQKVLIDHVHALSVEKVHRIPYYEFMNTFFTKELLDAMFGAAQTKFVEELRGRTPIELVQETILCEAGGEQYRDNPVICAPTWMTWREIQAVPWEEEGQSMLPDTDILMKRKDTISGGWKLLFDIMERLAVDYSDDGVRLVVWFDI